MELGLDEHLAALVFGALSLDPLGARHAKASQHSHQALDAGLKLTGTGFQSGLLGAQRLGVARSRSVGTRDHFVHQCR